jgi:hypothetical protein
MEPEDPRETLVECACCHQRVSPFLIVRLGGRALCPSCARGGDDEDEEEE